MTFVILQFLNYSMMLKRSYVLTKLYSYILSTKHVFVISAGLFCVMPLLSLVYGPVIHFEI